MDAWLGSFADERCLRVNWFLTSPSGALGGKAVRFLVGVSLMRAKLSVTHFKR